MTYSTTFTTNLSQLNEREKKKKSNVSRFVSIIFFFFPLLYYELRFNLSFIKLSSIEKKENKKKYLQTIKRKDEEMMERHDLLERISHSTNNDRRIDGS